MKKWLAALVIGIMAVVLAVIGTLYILNINKLEDTRSQVAELQEELNTVRDPAHFASLEALQDWLNTDDTNVAYASSRAVERAYILQVRALRYGYILPAYHEIDESVLYFYNMAYISGKLYRVSPSNDTISQISEIKSIEPIASHPLPLE